MKRRATDSKKQKAVLPKRCPPPTTPFFPGIDELDGSERLLKVTIDNGLKVGEGDQSAEVQIENLMADPRANYKLAADLKDDFGQYFAMAEAELWPSGAANRRTPWKDVVNRAK